MKSIFFIAIFPALLLSIQASAAQVISAQSEYYQKMQANCKTNSADAKKSEMAYYGSLNYGKTRSSNLMLDTFNVIMGGSAGGVATLYMDIYQKGVHISSYPVDEREVVYLNNTNPINAAVWVEIDKQREVAVLLYGPDSSCLPIGEVPYRK